jgi:hypothetical protein
VYLYLFQDSGPTELQTSKDRRQITQLEETLEDIQVLSERNEWTQKLQEQRLKLFNSISATKILDNLKIYFPQKYPSYVCPAAKIHIHTNMRQGPPNKPQDRGRRKASAFSRTNAYIHRLHHTQERHGGLCRELLTGEFQT